MGKVATAGVVPVAALAGVVGSASERLVGMATLAAPPVSRCFVPVCVPSAKLRFIKCEPDRPNLEAGRPIRAHSSASRRGNAIHRVSGHILGHALDRNSCEKCGKSSSAEISIAGHTAPKPRVHPTKFPRRLRAAKTVNSFCADFCCRINGQRDTWRPSTTCLPWLPAKSWMAGTSPAMKIWGPRFRWSATALAEHPRHAALPAVNRQPGRRRG